MAPAAKGAGEENFSAFHLGEDMRRVFEGADYLKTHRHSARCCRAPAGGTCVFSHCESLKSTRLSLSTGACKNPGECPDILSLSVQLALFGTESLLAALLHTVPSGHACFIYPCLALNVCSIWFPIYQDIKSLCNALNFCFLKKCIFYMPLVC